MVGRVVSDKGDQTVVVAVESLVRHPVYGKTLKRVTKFAVHDAGNQAHQGDLVEIMETRPLSKTKHWRMTKIVEKTAAPAPEIPEVAEEAEELERS